MKWEQSSANDPFSLLKLWYYITKLAGKDRATLKIVHAVNEYTA